MVAQTLQQILEATAGSAALPFEPGSIVLLHFDNHRDRVLWLWASLLAGYIPVMSTAFSDNASRRLAHLEHLARLLNTPACLTTTGLLLQFDGQTAIVPTCVDMFNLEDVGATPSVEGSRVTAPSPRPDQTAVLMLTSGSSGSCKAVALTHEQITAAVTGKHATLPIPADATFLSWVGLDHVAGLVEIHLQAIFTGRSQVLVEAPDVLMEPATLLNLVERHRVGWTFAPNFFLALMHATLQKKEEQQDASSDDQRQWDLTSLRWLTSGGEANTTQMCEEVSLLLERYGTPRNVIVPGFGMTETCAGAIFNTRFPEHEKAHGYPVASLGQCMPGVSVRVTDGTGTNIALPAGELGHLEVTGPAVFRSYFNNEEATRSSFTTDGWFATGDLAMIDTTEAGQLLLKGRVKDVLNINAVKYNPTDIEAGLYEAIPQLTYGSACCFSSLPADGHTEEVVIVYLPSYGPEDLHSHVQTVLAIRQACLEMTGSRPQVLPLSRNSVAKSSLGKLPRAQIKAAYERGEYQSAAEESLAKFALFQKTTDQEPRDELERQLLTIFVNSLDHATPEEFGVQTSILDLGITSIELIKLKRHIERDLTCTSQPGSIPLSTLMRNTTVRDLATALRRDDASPSSSATYDPVVPLQRRGTKTPLWLAHPGVGEVMAFMNLAKYFTDRPIFALRAAGFNDGEPLATSLDEMVRRYHAAIKLHQPQGPYALAGYSYGGMVAFELAKLLERHGDTVRFLGSFNLPPHIKKRMRQVDWKTALLDLCHFLDLLSEAGRNDLAAQLRDMGDRDAILECVLARIDKDRFAELALSPAALANWAHVGQNLHHLTIDYEPAPSVESIDVFYCHPIKEVASGKEEWFERFISLWGDFTRDEPRFHEVVGSHYTMISPENVFGFQKTMKAALAARGI
ncbi:putative non-ribosomal peptide synthase-like protein [Aspergillus homomorphus CBS 101889]|uniref:Putative non-ribosomal peptide synthase-like protein n=1 Tax=Aspergillus homomorphus (strain CBS 101889) TaxID=1450537 RepID=A0A395HQK2_ASPHC|nr:putative non-ribosomal peptide synthase-like protein [Aspergillus homomorphus CBS 101889]RAL08524.1 putative non-ribosomal peptide synthase-like protein [Aspergillus homomorphus CBS 101889]